MTEFKAILLVFVGAAILLLTACLALAAIDASGTAYGVAVILATALGADTSSRVVMHYGESGRHHR